MKSLKITIQMKATEWYFPVVLFTMQYEVVATFKSVDEILKCDHSNESRRAVLSCGAVQGGLNPCFWHCSLPHRLFTFKNVCEIPSLRSALFVDFVRLQFSSVGILGSS